MEAMEDTPNNPVESIKDTGMKYCCKCEEAIRSAPWTSVLMASTAGLFLRPTIIIGVVGVAVRLAIGAIKPALMVFAICKLTKLLRTRSAESSVALRPDASVPPTGL
jgi:hypothetical protein